ncbi:MAG: hypothetical protein Ta2B_10830 [Termitinemataceae bacterium]|nr:MAG: hypothetical protein Ta2B_10830 [Termitinemataceae bacterium]
MKNIEDKTLQERNGAWEKINISLHGSISKRSYWSIS